MKSEIVLAILLATGLAGTPAAGEPPSKYESLMQGKHDTGRTIEYRVIVNGKADEVFDFWSDSAATTGFFGIGATIEPRQGGLYEIVFSSPTGEPAGPRGTRILRYEPPQRLWFEWEMPRTIGHLNTRPLPTWVELTFEPFGSGEKTEIHLLHKGFGQGADWDTGFDFFLRNWFEVLYRLKQQQDHAQPAGQ